MTLGKKTTLGGKGQRRVGKSKRDGGGKERRE